MMYKLRCEWDVDQEGIVFTTKEKAIAWFNGNGNVIEMFESAKKYDAVARGCDNPFDYYNYSGLVRIEPVEVI